MGKQVILGINGIIDALRTSDDDSLSSSSQSSVQDQDDLEAVSSEDNIASNLLKVGIKYLGSRLFSILGKRAIAKISNKFDKA